MFSDSFIVASSFMYAILVSWSLCAPAWWILLLCPTFCLLRPVSCLPCLLHCLLCWHGYLWQLFILEYGCLPLYFFFVALRVVFLHCLLSSHLNHRYNLGHVSGWCFGQCRECYLHRLGRYCHVHIICRQHWSIGYLSSRTRMLLITFASWVQYLLLKYWSKLCTSSYPTTFFFISMSTCFCCPWISLCPAIR